MLNVALDLVSAHRALSEVNWGPHGPERVEHTRWALISLRRRGLGRGT